MILLFNQRRNQGQSKRGRVKAYYIGLQNIERLSETSCTQEMCWCIILRCVTCLWHPVMYFCGKNCSLVTIEELSNRALLQNCTAKLSFIRTHFVNYYE